MLTQRTRLSGCCLLRHGLQYTSTPHDCGHQHIAVFKTAHESYKVTGNEYRQAVREAATICPRPCKLTFDLLTLKVVSESHVTWATSVKILVFIGLSVLDLRDRRQTSDRQTSDAHHRLMSPTLGAEA